MGAPCNLHRLVAITHGAVEKRLNAFDQTELWVVLAAEPLEADECLEQESEVDRQHDRVLAQDRRYSAQQHPDLQILQRQVDVVERELAESMHGARLYRKIGCPRCSRTGYRGRIGIFQLLEMSERLELLASEKASREEIERAAEAEGMRTLWDDGVAKIAAGLTSTEELARVCIV